MKNGFLIEVNNRQSILVLDLDLLKLAVQLILEDEGLSRAEISIAIVDDQEMHQLNNQFLQHDYPTDVLSFVLENTDSFLNGEIIVSSQTAQAQAETHGLTVENECLLYVIHGCLHLVGYDDKEEALRAMMREREAYYLAACTTDSDFSPKREAK